MTGYKLGFPRLAIFFTTLCVLLTAATLQSRRGANHRPQGAPRGQRAAVESLTAEDRSRISAAYGRLPMSFEENRGQVAPVDGEAGTRFTARGAGYSLLIGEADATLVLAGADQAPSKKTGTGQAPRRPVVRMRWVGGNAGARARAERPIAARSNYFRGNDRSQWRTGVRHFDRVRSASVYPGVDVLYYGNQRQLEYDLEVAPGADPSVIQLALDGVDTASIAANGDLLLKVGEREVRQVRPVAYQKDSASADAREPVKSSYRLLSRGGDEPVRVAFQVGEYDRNRTLVIDPILRYSTLLGGGGDDYGMGIAIDATGSAYVTGYTGSYNRAGNSGPDGIDATPKFPKIPNMVGFPVVNGSGDPEQRFFQVDLDANGNPDTDFFLTFYDVFVTKFNPLGTNLVYSTYIGAPLGGGDSFGTAIAVDAGGRAYVTGMTTATAYPLVLPVQATNGGFGDAILTVLSPDGGTINYSTYFGGNGRDIGRSVALDSNGNTLITGLTTSTNLPVFRAIQPQYGGNQDQFVLNLDATGSAFNFCTYLGGSGFEGGLGPDNGVGPYSFFIAGRPINNTNPPRSFGGTSIGPIASELGSDYGAAAVFDAVGNVYVAGGTSSGNFPVTPGALKTVMGGASDAFVTKYNPFGSYIYSTYLGGDGDDGARAIGIDASLNAYVTGYTTSLNFPTVNPFQANLAGGSDAFVSKLNPAGNGLVASTYLGGSGSDIPYALAVDSGGNTYIVGSTQSFNFPLLNQVQGSLQGGQDIFLTKLAKTGSSLEYSTYLSGIRQEAGMGVAVDSQGSAFVTGIIAYNTFDMINGPGYPTTLGAFQPYGNVHIPVEDGSGATNAGTRKNLSSYGPYPLAEAFVTKVGSPPLAPSNLATTFVSTNQVDLAWVDNSNNEVDFVVERKDPGGNFVQIATVPANQVTFSNTGLISSTTYVYRVAARNVDGLSAYTNQVTVTTLPAAPNAPTALTVSTIDKNRLLLDWTDNSNNENEFRIERRTGSNPFLEIAVVARNVTNYTDTGLSADTTYDYRVRASNSGGFSAYSNTATGTTLPEPPQTAPQNLTATAISNTQIDLAWQNTNPTVTGFKIERSIQGGTFQLIRQTVGPATTFSDTGLPALTTFIYRVTAYNVSGDGPVSNPAQATTLEDPPTAPSGLQASVFSASRVDLSWNDTSSNETGFQIERSPDGSAFAAIGSTGANVTTFSDTSVVADTRYFYQVRALRNASPSGPSNLVSVTTPPVAPTMAVATTQSASRIIVSWTDASQLETGFRVEQGTDGVTFPIVAGSTGPGVTSLPVNGLVANTQYFFRVIAFNGGGDSPPSNTANATTAPNPPPPALSLAATVVNANRVDLNWIDSSTQETGFRIERATNGGSFTPIGSVGAGVTAFSDTTTQADTNYAYRVIAFNTGGDGLPSNTAFASTPPIAPLNLSATVISASQVDLAWTDVSQTETGFRIERSTNGGAFGSVGTTGAGATSFSDNTTQADQVYAYRVIAFNGGGDSPPSNVATATTPPTAPFSLSAVTASQSQINLFWQSNSQTETGFTIEQSLNGINFSPAGSAAANATSFQVNNLNASTQYFFRVTAFNGSGSSSPSNVASATTLKNPPKAPGQVRAFVRNATQIDVFWNDLSGDEDMFVIQRREAGNGFVQIGQVGPNVTQFSDPGRVRGVIYTYRVLSHNDGGFSVPSNEASAAIPRVGGRLVVNPTRLAFGNRISGRDAFLALTIRNAGTQPVSGKIGPLNSPFTAFIGGFAVSPSTGYFTLAPGQSLRVDVLFRAQPGSFSTSLVIENSAARIAVPVTGRGL